MKNLLTVLVCLFYCATLCAQDFSNKGKLFYIAYPAHIDGTNSEMGIYVTSDVTANVTIQVGSNNLSFSVPANQVVRKFIGTNSSCDVSSAAVYLSTQEGITNNSAIVVTSDKPVAVYAHIIRSARSGATLALPVNVWGKEYLVPNYRNQGSSAGYGEIAVMVSKPNTVVKITPTANSLNGAHTVAAGSFLLPPMNPGDVYQLQFAAGADISGTRVEAVSSSGTGGCNPIAVFSATTWTGLGCTGASGGDNLYQQLFPISAWGKNFLTAPFKTRNSDIIRVFINDPTTVVSKMENGVTTTLTGLVNSYYEFTTGNPTRITADKPVSVVMYITSQSCQSNGTNADPEMVLLNPIEQTISNITLFSPHRNFVAASQSAVTNCYLNIIMRNTGTGISSFRLDGGIPASPFIPIPGTGYSYLQQEITSNVLLSTNNGVSRITSDSAFIAIAYGFGNVESYGYNAGTSVKDLHKALVTSNSNTQSGINLAATCLNTDFTFTSAFNYQPTSMTWDFGNNAALSPNTAVTVNTPVYTSTTTAADGTTLYIYTLPGTYQFSATGSYDVNVITTSTTDACGGSNDNYFTVAVYDKPVADFNPTGNGCTNAPVTLTDQSAGNGRAVYKWEWDTDNNGTIDATTQNTTATYSTPANNARLKIYTDIGCVAEVVKPVTVSDPVTASFTAVTPFCDGQAITFNNTSPAGAAFYHWNFGNGNTNDATTNAAVTGTYTAGNYTASLQVETSTGCKGNTATQNISVSSKPVVTFTALPGICQEAGPLSLNQASPAGGMYSGTGVTGSGSSYSFSPAVSGYGTFNITYNYTNAQGCMADAAVQPITIWRTPDARFQPVGAACEGAATTLTDASNMYDAGTANQWTWTYGDGGPAFSGSSSVTHTYAGGTYYPTLQIKTDKNCVSAPYTGTVEINAVPVVSIQTPIAGACLPDATIQFSANASISAGSIAAYNWNFNDPLDGTPGTGASTQHTYHATGTYSIQLQAVSDKGCTKDAAPVSFTDVYDAPSVLITPAVSPAAICQYQTMQFTQTSSGGTGSTISNLVWDYGNGPVANQPYNTPGVYTISLTATDTHGCTATDNEQLTVYGYPSFTLPAAITVLEGGSVELPAQASGNQLQYLWQGANAYSNIGYLSSPTVLNPVLTPQTDQDLLYSLAVTGQGGCVALNSPQYIRVKVLKTPQIPNAFSPNHDGVHDNWVILYLNDYPGSTVQVFNRYGQEVFRSTGYNTAWDGKFKGQDLPIGTYYYIIDPKNGRRPISGSVTILR